MATYKLVPPADCVSPQWSLEIGGLTIPEKGLINSTATGKHGNWHSEGKDQDPTYTFKVTMHSQLHATDFIDGLQRLGVELYDATAPQFKVVATNDKTTGPRLTVEVKNITATQLSEMNKIFERMFPVGHQNRSAPSAEQQGRFNFYADLQEADMARAFFAELTKSGMEFLAPVQTRREIEQQATAFVEYKRAGGRG